MVMIFHFDYLEGNCDGGQVFYFSSLVTQVTSDLFRVTIYLAPSIFLGAVITDREGIKKKVPG